jgi:hypothetical protein
MRVVTFAQWIPTLLLGAAASVAPSYAPPPGALNPDVTQSNVAQTICVRGWTAGVRPPRAFTDALKRQQIAERHLPGIPADYEEDHLVPLELGGAPRDRRNLWPQPWPEAKRKDRLEAAYHRAVCAGRMTLSDARRMVVDPRKWRTP